MSEKMDLFLLNELNNIIEEKNFNRPKSFQELKNLINKNFNNITQSYIIFYQSKENKEIEINNNEDYKSCSNDILFIRNIEPNNIDQSLFAINYNKLSESKKERLDEKYTCFICCDNIKNENPYFCYICQKIFHNKCLKDWEQKRKAENAMLNCPNCRFELMLKDWKQKLDFDDKRKNDAEVMNELNNLKINKNFIENLNKINTKKINKLEEEKNQIYDKYNHYIKNTHDLFQNILEKLKVINSLINPKNNSSMITNIIKDISVKTIEGKIKDLSNIIMDEFKQIIEHIKKDKANNVLQKNLTLNENKNKNNIKKNENKLNKQNKDIKKMKIMNNQI